MSVFGFPHRHQQFLGSYGTSVLTDYIDTPEKSPNNNQVNQIIYYNEFNSQIVQFSDLNTINRTKIQKIKRKARFICDPRCIPEIACKSANNNANGHDNSQDRKIIDSHLQKQNIYDPNCNTLLSTDGKSPPHSFNIIPRAGIGHFLV